MRLLFLVIFLSSAVHAVAQKRTAYTVTLPTSKPIGITDFYVDAVEDDRLDKSDIGSAQIGLDNRRVPAVLDIPLERAILAYAYQSFRPKAGTPALTLRVQELTVEEVTKMSSERGFARVVISLVASDSMGRGRVVGTAEGSAEKGAIDVSGKLGGLVVEALTAALREIAASDWEAVAAGAQLVLEDDSPTFTRTVALPDGKHAYASLDDFAKRVPSDVPYRLVVRESGAGGSTAVLKKARGTSERPYAAVLVEDGRVYLASHLYNGGFTTRNQLREAKLVGRYLYFEDRWSSAAAGAAFGLVGALASMKTHGIVLDPMSGRIQLLTPELTATLATGHEDLAQRAGALGKKDVAGMKDIVRELNARYANGKQ